MDGLFIVTVEAQPLPGPNFESYGGAFINIFATVSTEAEALEVATREVAEAGWRFGSIDRVVWVTREDYVEDPTGLKYFEQALIDGVVVVIHTYSPEADKPDVHH